MSYTALARRYRSTQFDEVVGQDAIARTLASAIERDRVAHGYLFCGTRGVGKTTMARLFAKAVNAPGDEPKDVAQAIMEGRDTDVVEIDAASNRGVEEARELIANCIYSPMRGRYKIYIIDEVHMLTREAFNALLKTMEEPPAHVKFILCTTEAHKVPPTIQSRCQRFDFRAISVHDIGEHLKFVVGKEKVKAEPALLQAIARLGNGSMRDALSLLDRVMASGEKKLTLALLEELLGLPASDLVDGLIGACADGEPGEALPRAEALVASGVSIDQVLESLITRLRDLMVLSACGEATGLVDFDDDSRAHAFALASRFDAAALVHMIALCENTMQRCKSSTTPRALLDALVVRMAMTERIADVAALLRGAPEPAGADGPARGGGGPQKKARAAAAEPEPALIGPGAPPRTPPAPPLDAPTPEPEAPIAPLAPDAGEQEVWSRVRELGSDSAAMRARLRMLELDSIREGKATICVDSSATLTWAQSESRRLTELLRRATGREHRLEFVVDSGRSAPVLEDAAQAQRAMDEALDHPLVKKAIELFDARVVRVERTPLRREAESDDDTPDAPAEGADDPTPPQP